jgi:hypothetical protein
MFSWDTAGAQAVRSDAYIKTLACRPFALHRIIAPIKEQVLFNRVLKKGFVAKNSRFR